MRPEDRDLGFVWDIQEAARDITTFIKGVSLDKFNKNLIIRYAVERQLLVIGEAANHVSDDFKEKHSEIPWQVLIGQRNILAHQYGEIIAEKVWQTATHNIPELLVSLRKILD
ncbi:MAG: HepT-like ribonuclease domain-containing protein [Anaerolineaceae bacterium]